MLNKVEYRKKEVKSIEKEINNLFNAQQNLGSYLLDKPVHKGCFKHLILRDDISRRKDAFIFQNIIDVAGVEVWGSNEKDADKSWMYQMKQNNNVYEPGLIKINDKEYEKLLPKAKQYFEGFEAAWSHWRGSEMIYYSRVPRYYFTTGYTKAFITHRKIIDPELQEKMDELEALIMRSGYYQYSWNVGYYKDKWAKPFSQKKMRRKTNMILNNLDKNDEVDEFVYKDASKLT